MELKMEPLKKEKRPTWEETFMRQAIEAGKMSHCIWVEVGALIAITTKGRTNSDHGL